MDNATVIYTGAAFPASTSGFGVSVDWSTQVEKGLNRVRSKFHSVRGADYVIIRSNRSGGLFCITTRDWKKAGGKVPQIGVGA